jgi:hypothetical protein
MNKAVEHVERIFGPQSPSHLNRLHGYHEAEEHSSVCPVIGTGRAMGRLCASNGALQKNVMRRNG